MPAWSTAGRCCSRAATGRERLWPGTGWRTAFRSAAPHARAGTAACGCSDMDQILDAAMAGLGVALLPDRVCRSELDAGHLVRVLPAWHGQIGVVHLVFTTRRGLSPAVRALIGHLVKDFPPAIAVGQRA
ncbi:LysR substrate-binding domain-containing protein [Ancylobacter pratisalsi]|uniref:LysR substrate-binding domain-containing protein n=1 Tax=Ancylobacter pratisalsi TaxID=1745854 RepID=UPI001FE81652|nr:LysR substrate-binding domain-containing protein [Ancylobacter pratisalsi]